MFEVAYHFNGEEYFRLEGTYTSKTYAMRKARELIKYTDADTACVHEAHGNFYKHIKTYTRGSQK